MLAPAFLCGYSECDFRVLEVFTRISTETGSFSTKSADLSTKRDVSCIAGRGSGWSTQSIDSDRSGPPGPGVAGEDGSEGQVRKNRFARVSPERPVRKDGFSQGKVRDAGPQGPGFTDWPNRRDRTACKGGDQEAAITAGPFGGKLAPDESPGCAGGDGLTARARGNTAARRPVLLRTGDGRLVRLASGFSSGSARYPRSRNTAKAPERPLGRAPDCESKFACAGNFSRGAGVIQYE